MQGKKISHFVKIDATNKMQWITPNFYIMHRDISTVQELLWEFKYAEAYNEAPMSFQEEPNYGLGIPERPTLSLPSAILKNAHIAFLPSDSEIILNSQGFLHKSCSIPFPAIATLVFQNMDFVIPLNLLNFQQFLALRLPETISSANLKQVQKLSLDLEDSFLSSAICEIERTELCEKHRFAYLHPLKSNTVVCDSCFQESECKECVRNLERHWDLKGDLRTLLCRRDYIEDLTCNSCRQMCVADNCRECQSVGCLCGCPKGCMC